MENTKTQNQSIFKRQAIVLHRDILNALPAHAALINRRGVIVEVNRAWKNFAAENGCKEISAYVGSNYLEICKASTEPEARLVYQGLKSVLSSEKEAFALEYPCSTENEQFWYKVMINPVGYPIHGAIVMHMNITDRVKAEQARARSESKIQKLALAASRTDNAIIITDAQLKIEWVNEGFTHITGYDMEEVIGKTTAELMHGPETEQETVVQIQKRISHGQPYYSELTKYTKSGQKFYMSIDCQPVHDEHDNLTNFVIIEHDITEQVNLQKRALQVTAHAKLLEGIQQVAVTVQHEINNPLTAILGNAELITYKMNQGFTTGDQEFIYSSAQNISILARRIAETMNKLKNMTEPVMTSHPIDFEHDIPMISLEDSK